MAVVGLGRFLLSSCRRCSDLLDEDLDRMGFAIWMSFRLIRLESIIVFFYRFISLHIHHVLPLTALNKKW